MNSLKKQLEYIRKTYNVPARKGVRVKFNELGTERFGASGTIVGATPPYLKVRFDGDKYPVPVHPKAVDYESDGRE